MNRVSYDVGSCVERTPIEHVSRCRKRGVPTAESTNNPFVTPYRPTPAHVLDPFAVLLLGMGHGLIFNLNRLRFAIPTAHEVVTVFVVKLDSATGAKDRVTADILNVVADHEIAHEVQLFVVVTRRAAERAVAQLWTRFLRCHAFPRSSVRFDGWVWVIARQQRLRAACT